ncbi:glycosyltransferase family 25 protein [Parabacteroides bouchesdurhonensis]|uniref:glycosyltransferase family 25 protein n=1 Tax=Parabacteroides bouchesdurhonensis TaxID=1936995 RepID=UPI000C8247EF|nr:glycosyltransferase family 25 protein [Parabacteroides bouchesdurhonensis]
MKTYIVNLKECVERRKHVLHEIEKYPFMDAEIIDAVNGKLMSDEEISRVFDIKKFKRRYGRFPVKGEIGCTLSHRKCYRSLLSTDEPYALILEDDVSFISPEDTEFIIKQGAKLLEEGKTDIVLFVPMLVLYNRPRKINEKYVVYPVYAAYETCAYLISRKGAKRLLKDKRSSLLADDFIYMNRHGIRIKAFYPNIAVGLSTIDKMEGIIGKEERKKVRLHVEFPFWEKVKRCVLFIYSIIAIKKGWLIDKDYYKWSNK